MMFVLFLIGTMTSIKGNTRAQMAKGIAQAHIFAIDTILPDKGKAMSSANKIQLIKLISQHVCSRVAAEKN